VTVDDAIQKKPFCLFEKKKKEKSKIDLRKKLSRKKHPVRPPV
jgi:hypothetical protein